MKYTELTKEQRESMTNHLRDLLKVRDEYDYHSKKWLIVNCRIKSYQQAQKAEIEDLIIILNASILYINSISKDFINATIDKLKFESELE